jgi:hypothetical protein|tara:strand:- start:3000 stop:3767 length:768 start_codon:yes stop_codon:yes gene_type:complete
MEQTSYKFPSEIVTLPSKGLIYPEDSPLKKGEVEMKYMTAREEDILTNQNLIQNGTVIDKLLQALILTPINYDDLLVGDKNAILVASRILGYGKDYKFKFTHPNTGKETVAEVDLTQIEDKELDKSRITNSKNEFSYTLPISKIVITFKLLTHGDESKILQELKGLEKLGQGSASLTTKLKHTILSIDGDYDKKTVREFVDNRLLARDSKSFRDYLSNLMPDVKLVFNYKGPDGNVVEEVPIPIGVTFFWPEAEV